MKKEALNSGLEIAHFSGWKTAKIILEGLKQLLKFVDVSAQNPSLLVLDNHRNHVNLDVTLLAQKHGLDILTFPPHYSHFLQPLDVHLAHLNPFTANFSYVEGIASDNSNHYV